MFNRSDNFDLKKYRKDTTCNFKESILKYLFTFKVNPSVINHIKERPFITISNTTVKDYGLYIDIRFDVLYQGIEFAFGYWKDVKIVTPIEAIEIIKKKAIDVIGLYKGK